MNARSVLIAPRHNLPQSNDRTEATQLSFVNKQPSVAVPRGVLQVPEIASWSPVEIVVVTDPSSTEYRCVTPTAGNIRPNISAS
jgi:hypothetical protein